MIGRHEEVRHADCGDHQVDGECCKDRVINAVVIDHISCSKEFDRAGWKGSRGETEESGKAGKQRRGHEGRWLPSNIRAHSSTLTQIKNTRLLRIGCLEIA